MPHHKKCACEIWKPCLKLFQTYGKVYTCRSKVTVKVKNRDVVIIEKGLIS